MMRDWVCNDDDEEYRSWSGLEEAVVVVVVVVVIVMGAGFGGFGAEKNEA